VLFSTLVLAGCGEKSAADGKVGLEFNDRCYRIPKWNARLINASAGFPFSESRKSTRSLRLRFFNAEIHERITGYELPLMYSGQPLEGELVSFYAPSPDELAQIRRNEVLKQQEFFSLWYAEGDWTQRTIEPASVPGLFRVSFFPNGNSWMVVTRKPDMQARDSHLAKEFWISSCYVMEGTPRTTCLLKLEQDGIFMDARTPESNLPYREQLGRFFLEKLDSWKVACEGAS
jgi:hypothetical protein